MRKWIAFFLFLACILGMGWFYRHSYSPPASPLSPALMPPSLPSHPSTTADEAFAGAPKTLEETRMPLKCAIVISEKDKREAEFVVDVKLLRSVGSMMADHLTGAAKSYFEEVQIVSHERDAQDADVVIAPRSLGFDYEGNTGYTHTNFPFVYGWGTAYASLDLEATVNGGNVEPFRVKESAVKASIDSHGLFIMAKTPTMMTQATELAIIEMCQRMAVGIATVLRNPQIFASRRGDTTDPQVADNDLVTEGMPASHFSIESKAPSGAPVLFVAREMIVPRSNDINETLIQGMGQLVYNDDSAPLLLTSGRIVSIAKDRLTVAASDSTWDFSIGAHTDGGTDVAPLDLSTLRPGMSVTITSLASDPLLALRICNGALSVNLGSKHSRYVPPQSPTICGLTSAAP